MRVMVRARVKEMPSPALRVPSDIQTAVKKPNFRYCPIVEQQPFAGSPVGGLLHLLPGHLRTCHASTTAFDK
jgi:hypothetical protein